MEDPRFHGGTHSRGGLLRQTKKSRQRIATRRHQSVSPVKRFRLKQINAPGTKSWEEPEHRGQVCTWILEAIEDKIEGILNLGLCARSELASRLEAKLTAGRQEEREESRIQLLG